MVAPKVAAMSRTAALHRCQSPRSGSLMGRPEFSAPRRAGLFPSNAKTVITQDQLGSAGRVRIDEVIIEDIPKERIEIFVAWIDQH
jgi:hypothetical protein